MYGFARCTQVNSSGVTGGSAARLRAIASNRAHVAVVVALTTLTMQTAIAADDKKTPALSAAPAPQAAPTAATPAAATAPDAAATESTKNLACVDDDGSVPPGLEAKGLPTGEIRRAHTAMGTTLALGATGVSCKEATAAFTEVFEEFSRVERLVDPTGENGLGAVNRNAGVDAVAVDPELFALIELALAIAKETDGAFDPTFAALNGLWRFPKAGESHDVGVDETRLPDPAAIEQRLPLIDHRNVVMTKKGRTVFLPTEGMALSLGGIARGYATDNAVRILRRRGIADFIVRTPGEIYISGDPGGGMRKVLVPSRDVNHPVAKLEVRNGALNISRDGDRYFTEGGVRYHHIIDPRTGFPAHHVRTVAVVAADAATADALSTGIFVLGAEKGLALVERWRGVEAIIVDSNGAVWSSSGIEGLELLPQPRRTPR